MYSYYTRGSRNVNPGPEIFTQGWRGQKKSPENTPGTRYQISSGSSVNLENRIRCSLYRP